jgi:hypothetical protein
MAPTLPSELTIAALLRDRVELAPHEAAAIVGQLCRAPTARTDRALAPLDALLIDRNGTVIRLAQDEAPDEARLVEAALVLRAMLPDPSTSADSPTADLLRHLARTVLVRHPSPVFTTLQQFCRALHAFTGEDTAGTVAAIVERWQGSEDRAGGAGRAGEVKLLAKRHDETAAPAVTAIEIIDVDVDEPSPWEVAARADAREADAPRAVETSGARESAPTGRWRGRAGQRSPRMGAVASFGTTAASIALIALGVSAVASFTSQVASSRTRSGPSTVQRAQEVLSTDVDLESSRRNGVAAATDRPQSIAPAAPVMSSAEGTAQPRRGAPLRLAPLSVAIEPTFSPSFSRTGQLYFRAGRDGPSKLMRADARGDGKRPDVWRVLDDGARNYHPSVSPDGRLVAFDSDREGTRGVYLLDLERHVLWRATGAGDAAAPSWSPDGASLAFVRADEGKAKSRNVWRLVVKSGQSRRLPARTDGASWSVSWFPNGKRVCYSHEDRLVVLDLVSGTSQVYAAPRPGALIRTPAVSPDGRYIAFQVLDDGMWIFDVARGGAHRVLADSTAEGFAWAPDGSQIAFHSRRDGGWRVWLLTNPTS